MKDFLYYLRGVLACRWVESKSSLPPMHFTRLLEGTVEDEEIRSKVINLIKIKKSGKCFDDVVVDADLIETAKKWALYYDDLSNSSEQISNPGFANELDALFKEMMSQFN